MLKLVGRILSMVVGLLLFGGSVAAAGPVGESPSDSLRADTTTYDSAGVIIRDIILEGNEKTRDYIISRELSYGEGELFPLKLLQELKNEDENKLMNTRLFNSVSIELLPQPGDSVNVMVTVEERWYTFPAPIFKLADRNFNVWWDEHRWDFSRLYYGLRLIQENVGGRNERLKFIAQFGFLKNFELQYRFPYIDAKRTKGLNFGISYLENNNIAVSTVKNKLTFFETEGLLRRSYKGSVNLFFRPNYYNYHDINAGFAYISIRDTVLTMNDNYFLGDQTFQRFASLSYSFLHDKRDLRTYPIKGHYLRVYLQKIGLGIFQDINQFSVQATAAKYWPLKHKFYFSSRLAARYSGPDNQPYNLLTGLGYGNNFVRGYELYVIDGQHFFLEKATFKKKILGVINDFSNLIPVKQFQKVPLDIYLKTYFDSGFVQRKNVLAEQNNYLTNRFIWGSGIGLDIVSYYDSVFTFEYSINRQKETGFFVSLKADI